MASEARYHRILTQSVIICVISDKLHNFSLSHFVICHMEIMISKICYVCKCSSCMFGVFIYAYILLMSEFTHSAA